MPFTLSHAAAILPLHKPLGRFGVLSALTVGSVTPDLVLFLPMGIQRTDSHSILGLLWFCLPAGLIAYCLFHLLLAPVLYGLLLPSWQARLPDAVIPGRLPAVALRALAVALLIGALTHVVWDALTHASGFVVQLFPVLQTRLSMVGGYTVFVYSLLQHGSTVVGLALLLLWGGRWMQATPPSQEPWRWQLSPGFWLLSLVLLLVVPTFAGMYAGLGSIGNGGMMQQLQQVLGWMIFTSGSVFCAMWLGLGCLWRWGIGPANAQRQAWLVRKGMR